MESNVIADSQYREWLKELKQKVRLSQLKAAVAVNTALLEFYWELGTEIVERQKTSIWGSGFLKQLSADLMAEFPDMKGFSEPNLRFIRRWVLFYLPERRNSVTACDRNAQLPAAIFMEQLVPQLVKIPWGHNRVIITKCSDVEDALFYVQQTIENNWSRNVLTHQIMLNGILFEIGMTEMSRTIYAQMEESAKLDEVIWKNLEGLGYGE